jgi:hypothetical protein
MTPAEIAFAFNSAIALGLVVAWCRASLRADKRAAEIAYLRSIPPTSQLVRVEIINPHRFADPTKEMVRVTGIDGKPATLAFTDASFSQALIHGSRIDTLLQHGQARVLPPK